MDVNKNNNFSEFEKKQPLSDKELFSAIWSNPKKAFKYIHTNHYDKYLVILLFLSGIVKTFDRAAQKNMGDQMSLLGVIGVSVILGGLLGWISMYIYAMLVNWTGKWLGANGNTKSLLLIFAYATIPSIISLFAIAFQILLVGNAIFQKDNFPALDNIQLALFYAAIIAEITLSIWSFILLVIGVSIAQKLSIGKAIVNLLLPILIVVIPIVIYVVLVM